MASKEPIDGHFYEGGDDVPEVSAEDINAIVWILRSKGPQTARDISNRLGSVYEATCKALHVLEEDGRVEARTQSKHRRWHLLEDNKEEEVPNLPASEAEEEYPGSDRNEWGYGVHPAAFLFPLMTDEEFQELKEDIRVNGLKEKIVFYDGFILDGRHRFRALQELGIPLLEENSEQWDEQGSPFAYVLSKNLRRRHLTKGQLAFFATKNLREIEEAAVGMQSAFIRDIEDAPSSDFIPENFARKQNEEVIPGQVAAAAAQLFGVNPHYIYDAQRLLDARPDLADMVQAGTISLNKAMAQMKSDAEAKEQAAEETPPHPGGDGPTVSGALPGLEEEGRQARYAAHPDQEPEKETLRLEPTYKKRKGSFFYATDVAWDATRSVLTFTMVRPAIPAQGLKKQETKGLGIPAKALIDLGFRLPGETKANEDPFGDEGTVSADEQVLDLLAEDGGDEKYIH